MKKDKLAAIIEGHKKWLDDEGGSRANLSGADLSRADLSGAYLSRADLSGAYLSRADLSGAYLSGANLSGADLSGAYLSRADLSRADLSRADLSGAYLSRADLSGADLSGTILGGINWLAYIGIVPDKKGIAYAYKITNKQGEGIFNGGINYVEATHFEVSDFDDNPGNQCSKGINLATFSWCLNQFNDKTYRLFIFKFNVKDAVCPVGSDGKFRVKECDKVSECDWKGNMLKTEENGYLSKGG